MGEETKTNTEVMRTYMQQGTNRTDHDLDPLDTTYIFCLLETLCRNWSVQVRPTSLCRSETLLWRRICGSVAYRSYPRRTCTTLSRNIVTFYTSISNYNRAYISGRSGMYHVHHAGHTGSHPAARAGSSCRPYRSGLYLL